jgi:hypothetical protein
MNGRYTLREHGREGRGRIKDRSSTEHPKVFVYGPTEVVRDTAFPFDWKKGEEVVVKIEGQKLIILKSENP